MRCIYKGIAESESSEGYYIRSVHPEINFKYCLNHCKGYDLTDCPNFPAKTRDEKRTIIRRNLELVAQ